MGGKKQFVNKLMKKINDKYLKIFYSILRYLITFEKALIFIRYFNVKLSYL